MAVYLLHFTTPLHHARHYVGFAENGHTLRRRIDHHRAGTSGCRIMEVCAERGIDFVVARIWRHADRNFERRIKNNHATPTLCPICSGPAALNRKR